MKNPNYPIGNRTRDLSVCSAVLNQMSHLVPPNRYEGVKKNGIAVGWLDIMT
jgi:hypothetical protein